MRWRRSSHLLLALWDLTSNRWNLWKTRKISDNFVRANNAMYDSGWEMSEKIYIVPSTHHTRIIRALSRPYTYENSHTRTGRGKNSWNLDHVSYMYVTRWPLHTRINWPYAYGPNFWKIDLAFCMPHTRMGRGPQIWKNYAVPYVYGPGHTRLDIKHADWGKTRHCHTLMN